MVRSLLLLLEYVGPSRPLALVNNADEEIAARATTTGRIHIWVKMSVFV